MKKTELIFNLISIPVDAAMLFIAGLVAFYLRENTTNIVGPIIYNLEIKTFIADSFNILPVLLLIFALLGLYNLKGTRKFSEEFAKITIGASLGLLLFILFFFFNQ